MSKYEISDVTKNDLRESQRMLAQHPKILGALDTLSAKEESFKQDQLARAENAETDGMREHHLFLASRNHDLKEPQRMMILHVTGQLDWNQSEQIANKFGFSDEAIKQLSSYIKYQEIISSVIGWDRLIDLMVFVIQGRYSIRSFYQDLFLKINKCPRNQWSDKMDRIIQGIRGRKPFKDILEDLGLK